jgi:formylglycine-generating enzyme required for sulfatase activity
VEVGPLCVDRYEASAWSTTHGPLIKKIKNGTATLAQLQANAVQHGAGTGLGDPASCDYDTGCPETASGCVDFYAVSIPGVIPAQCVNYFRAAAICRNSGKRLLTNQEWQVAAFGTPDPNPAPNDPPPPAPACNVGDGSPNVQVALTGSRSECVSDVRVFDMVGNVVEFVAEWGEVAEVGGTWDQASPVYGGDVSHVGSDGITSLIGLPGHTVRGGGYVPGSGGTGAHAGVFAIDQNGAPFATGSGVGVGFRCARPKP